MSNLDVSEGLAPEDLTETAAQSDLAEENSRRLRAWMDAGATNVPALLIALGSASVGGLAVLARRRRKS